MTKRCAKLQAHSGYPTGGQLPQEGLRSGLRRRTAARNGAHEPLACAEPYATEELPGVRLGTRSASLSKLLGLKPRSSPSGRGVGVEAELPAAARTREWKLRPGTAVDAAAEALLWWLLRLLTRA